MESYTGSYGKVYRADWQGSVSDSFDCVCQSFEAAAVCMLVLCIS